MRIKTNKEIKIVKVARKKGEPTPKFQTFIYVGDELYGALLDRRIHRPINGRISDKPTPLTSLNKFSDKPTPLTSLNKFKDPKGSYIFDTVKLKSIMVKQKRKWHILYNIKIYLNENAVNPGYSFVRNTKGMTIESVDKPTMKQLRDNINRRDKTIKVDYENIVDRYEISNVRIKQVNNVNLLNSRLGDYVLSYNPDDVIVRTGNCVPELLKAHGFTDKKIKEYEKRGVSSELSKFQWTGNKLLEFCKLNNTSCYVCDMDYKVIDKHSAANNRKKAIMCYIANNHVYEVTSSSARKIIQVGMVVKDKSKKFAKKVEKMDMYVLDKKLFCYTKSIKMVKINENEEDIVDVDDIGEYDEEFKVKFEELKENSIYYIEYGYQDLIKILVYMIKELKYVPVFYESNDKITFIYYKKKNIKFFYNEHMRDAIKTCETLGKQFNNQSITMLAKEICEENKVNIEKLESKYHLDTRKIFDDMHIGGKYFYNGNTDRKKVVKSLDIIKCYSSIIRDYKLSVFDVMDEIEDVKLDENESNIQVGWYYLETDDGWLFKGNGWYKWDLVKVGLRDRIKMDIKYFVKCKEINIFDKFIDDIYGKYKSCAKNLANCLVGSLGMRMKNSKKTRIVTDWLTCQYYLWSNANVSKLSSSNIYKISHYEENHSVENTLPAFYSVIQIGWLKAYELSKLVQNPIGIMTDCVYYTGKHNANVRDRPKIGGIRVTKSMMKECEMKINKDTYVYEKIKINKIDEDSEIDVDSCLIKGPPGSGKSVRLKKLFDRLGGLKVAPTNIAGRGSTLHKLLGKKVNGKSKINMKHKIIYVDEASMISIDMLKDLLYLKYLGVRFYLFGDFDQYLSIEDGVDLEWSHLVMQLCDGNVMELTKIYRSDEKYINKIKQGDYSSFRDDNDLDKINICKVNAKVDEVNAICMKKFGGMDKIGCRVTPLVNLVNKKIYRNAIYERVDKNKFKELYTDEENIVTVDDLSKWKLAYAITSHKSQGLTIDEKYTVYEFDALCKRGKYVALSRCRKPSDVKVIRTYFDIDDGEVKDISEWMKNMDNID